MATKTPFKRNQRSFRRPGFWIVSTCRHLRMVAFTLSLSFLLAGSPPSRQDAPAGGSTPAEPSRTRVKSLEIVVLSTMLTDRAGIGEWGFSALVAADGHRILFDTGARPETVLHNAARAEDRSERRE